MNHTVNSTCVPDTSQQSFFPLLVVFHFDMGHKAMILTAPSLKVVVCLLWRVTSKSPVALGFLRTKKRWYTCLVTSLWHVSMWSIENKASIAIPLCWKKTEHINAKKIKNSKRIVKCTAWKISVTLIVPSAVSLLEFLKCFPEQFFYYNF